MEKHDKFDNMFTKMQGELLEGDTPDIGTSVSVFAKDSFLKGELFVGNKNEGYSKHLYGNDIGGGNYTIDYYNGKFQYSFDYKVLLMTEDDGGYIYFLDENANTYSKQKINLPNFNARYYFQMNGEGTLAFYKYDAQNIYVIEIDKVSKSYSIKSFVTEQKPNVSNQYQACFGNYIATQNYYGGYNLIYYYDSELKTLSYIGEIKDSINYISNPTQIIKISENIFLISRGNNIQKLIIDRENQTFICSRFTIELGGESRNLTLNETGAYAVGYHGSFFTVYNVDYGNNNVSLIKHIPHSAGVISGVSINKYGNEVIIISSGVDAGIYEIPTGNKIYDLNIFTPDVYTSSYGIAKTHTDLNRVLIRSGGSILIYRSIDTISEYVIEKTTSTIDLTEKICGVIPENILAGASGRANMIFKLQKSE